MKEVLRQLIVDFHGGAEPPICRRDIEIPSFSPRIRKASVFIGMRRCGKTWLMYQHMRELARAGVPREKLLHLNFEDDRLIPFSHKHFQSILDAYFELYPQFAGDNDIHFFFDEIHEIRGWEKFVRRVLDKERAAVYLTGSSSKMLSKEIATSLRGRTISTEVFPFSFREYLRSKGSMPGKTMTTKERNKTVGLFRDFLLYGGFPERIGSETTVFSKLLQGYLDVVIYRDVVERHRVSNPHIVRELLAFCIQNCADLVSVLNIYNRFKSLGRSVSKNMLYEYMSYLEDAYCIYMVPIFTFSHAKKAVNPKKLYAVDQGLITACSVKPRFEEAMRFENTVFAALRRRTEHIAYYKTRTGKEVDFVVGDPGGTTHLIQACQTLSHPSTRKRELTALLEAMEELDIDNGTILTLDETETVVEAGRTIAVQPLWEWLLTV